MANSIDNVLAEFESHWSEHLEDLKNLVRIPSVSFDGFDPAEVKRSAAFVAELMKKRGLENVEVIGLGDAHPYVYGEWLKAPGKPTVLLYAHHDVQPPGRADVWKTKPFEPTLKDGPGGKRLYARGIADDKAGVIVHTAAIGSYLKVLGKLPLNVKVVIEGEEEVGSTHLFEFLQKNRQKLQADVLILTDTTNFDVGIPALTIALRGLVGVGVELRALNGTVHSGMWGGPIPDPVMALSKILAGMTDSEGNITIPGIREMIMPLSKEEESEFKALPFNEARFREQVGLRPTAKLLRQGPSPLAQVWRYPSLTVTAIQASSRAQPGNIINDVAWAKVTIRVAPGMDEKKVNAALVDYIRKQVPWGLELVLEEEVCSGPWYTDPRAPRNEKAFQIAEQALEKGYGKPVVKMGCGGSIPFVQPFAEALGGAPALLIGVEDPFTNAHGENESLLVEDLRKACVSQIHLFQDLAEHYK